MIGVFGGTFNPIHNGHVRAAIDVREQLGLERVLIMPANLPPHRANPEVSSSQRAEMVQLAIKGIPGLRIERCELKRSGPSYTVDTLKLLKERLGQPMVLIVGADAFSSLPNWHRWKQLSKLAHIAVMRRPGRRVSVTRFPAAWVENKLTDSLSGANGSIQKVAISRTDISSTEIRARIAAGRSIRYLVPESVESYIKQHKLYR